MDRCLSDLSSSSCRCLAQDIHAGEIALMKMPLGKTTVIIPTEPINKAHAF